MNNFKNRIVYFSKFVFSARWEAFLHPRSVLCKAEERNGECRTNHIDIFGYYGTKIFNFTKIWILISSSGLGFIDSEQNVPVGSGYFFNTFGKSKYDFFLHFYKYSIKICKFCFFYF